MSKRAPILLKANRAKATSCKTREQRRQHAFEVQESRKREKSDIRYFRVPLKKTAVVQGLRDAGIRLTENDEYDYRLQGRLVGDLVVLPLTMQKAAELLVRWGRLAAAEKHDEALVLEALAKVIQEALPDL
jgi:hypothetical protein